MRACEGVAPGAAFAPQWRMRAQFQVHDHDQHILKADIERRWSEGLLLHFSCDSMNKKGDW